MPSKLKSLLPSNLPVAALLLAATLWGIFWYPLRLLEEHGLHGLWATLLIFASALLVGLPVLWRRRGELGRHRWMLLWIALANGWCNTAFILAVLDGTVVRVLLLFYLSPLWTIMLGHFLLKEKPSRFALTALALAMVGMVITIWEPELGFPWPEGRADWLAISSGFAFALSNVLVRKAQEVTIPIKTVTTWAGVVGVAGAWVMVSGVPVPSIGAGVYASVFAIGVLGIVLMTVAVQYGVANMPVHRSSVILLSEVVAGAVSAQLLTNEVVLPREWMGGALILLAGWFSTREERNGKDHP